MPPIVTILLVLAAGSCRRAVYYLTQPGSGFRGAGAELQQNYSYSDHRNDGGFGS